MRALVLGGAEAGKSLFAERLASHGDRAGERKVYLATASIAQAKQHNDAAMLARIARHQARRGDTWETHEVPTHLPEAIESAAAPETVLLVDCLTLWLSNLMAANHDLEQAIEHLADVWKGIPGQGILVSNEVGCGGVAMTAPSRRFQQAQGNLNQRMAAISNVVIFVVAGMPMLLKGHLAPDMPLP